MHSPPGSTRKETRGRQHGPVKTPHQEQSNCLSLPPSPFGPLSVVSAVGFPLLLAVLSLRGEAFFVSTVAPGVKTYPKGKNISILVGEFELGDPARGKVKSGRD